MAALVTRPSELLAATRSNAGSPTPPSIIQVSKARPHSPLDGSNFPQVYAESHEPSSVHAANSTSSQQESSNSEPPGNPVRTSPLLKIRIGNRSCRAVVDTGSAITVQSTRFWSKEKSARSQWRLRSVTGLVAPLYGPVSTPFHLNDQEVNFPIFVADILDYCLLGEDFLSSFKCFLSMPDYSVQLTLRPYHTSD